MQTPAMRGRSPPASSSGRTVGAESNPGSSGRVEAPWATVRLLQGRWLYVRGGEGRESRGGHGRFFSVRRFSTSSLLFRNGKDRITQLTRD